MNEQQLRVDTLQGYVFDPKNYAPSGADYFPADVVTHLDCSVSTNEANTERRTVEGVRQYLRSKTVGALTDGEFPQYLDLCTKRIHDLCRFIVVANCDEPATSRLGFEEIINDHRRSCAELSATTDPLMRVNGVSVTAKAITAEARHCATVAPATAFTHAAYALAVRILLMQQAAHKRIKRQSCITATVRGEANDEAIMRILIDTDVPRIGPDEATCRSLYSGYSYQFSDHTTFEVSHILLSTNPSNNTACDEASSRAGMLIGELAKAPERFELLAQRWSNCDSRNTGGHLGTIMQGQMPREVEMFLYGAEEGQISPVPIKSRLGVHVVRLDKRTIGNLLPFEHARPRISHLLTEWAWCQNLAAYIDTIVNKAVIESAWPLASSPCNEIFAPFHVGCIDSK